MPKITINIFEKSFLVAKGLKSLLRELNKFDIEAIISNFDDFEIIIKQSKPSVIVLNTEIYNQIPIELFKKLKSKYKFLVIGINKNDDKQIDEIFVDSIDYDENRMEIISKFNYHLKSLNIENENLRHDNELSDREKAILEWLAKGLTNKEVAEKLFISVHTVNTHRKNIVKKLGIRTLSGLTVYAILNKIVNMNDLN
ncbi:MAG: helix-turn-helix transcriptional regulator [Bacteroidales bacterium]|nr:helix-turn-helix transcriptional regulator [Bacteroidales bacterium]MBN2755973.1 helix-turn-helix transcriptional regulator [Bacteroidales bacterium]